MDRMAARERPDRSPWGEETWRDLVFLHWAVPTREVRRLLPSGLEPDLFRGIAYVGVSILEATRARPAFMPLRMGLKFHQITVRTYVTSSGQNPGVYVLSLDASSRLFPGLVRSLVSVPAFHAQVRRERVGASHAIAIARDDAEVGLRARWRPGRRIGEVLPGSLGFFLLERYMLYFESAGMLFRMRVHHAPYRVQNARVEAIDESLVSAAGVRVTAHRPRHAYLAEPVELEVFSPEMVERPVSAADLEAAPLWVTNARRLVVSG